MTGKFQRLAKLVTHSPSNGSYHEEILRAVLRNFLSKRYSVKTGFVYQDSKSVSRQVDILIIDEDVSNAYIFQEGDFAVVSPRAVVAAIEVKTSMTPSNFEEALLNIASVKQFSEFHLDIAGIIFSYRRKEGTPTDRTIDNWFMRSAAKEVGAAGLKLAPDLITFFENNCSLMRFNSLTNLINDSELYRKFYPAGDSKAGLGWQLTFLLSMIIGACERRDFKRTRMLGQSEANKLLRAIEVAPGLLEFKLGEGIFLPSR